MRRMLICMLQVKTALHQLISQTILCDDITTAVLAYNSKATPLDITKDNYQAKIEELKASGQTNFVAVFHMLNQLMTKYGIFLYILYLLYNRPDTKQLFHHNVAFSLFM